MPHYTLTRAEPTAIARIAVRGNRDYADGYDFHHVQIQILGPAPAVATDSGTDAEAGAANAPSAPVLWTRDVWLPASTRDVDIAVSPPVTGYGVRLTSLADESDEPGLSEIEFFAD